MFNISILTIGDEICIGQIVNNNAAWIATQCTQLGAHVHLHSTVGDEKEIIIKEVDRLLNNSDFVITTGGLGPTHDDITKAVLAEYFEDKLVYHEPTLKYLEELFKKRDIKMLERNKMMALLPSKCEVLQNRVGTAPGMMFSKSGKYLVALPGVPSEMRSIMENSVLPIIQQHIIKNKSEILLYKTIQTINIPESYLAELLGEPSSFLGTGNNTLAFLPSYRGVKLRIGIAARDFETAQKELDKIEKYIRGKAKKYIFTVGEENISTTVGKTLTEQKKTLSVAESCTGGLLGSVITDNSGSSAYFMGGVIVYSNEAKINVLGVKTETIEKYGAVSSETAFELAQKVRIKFNTDFGIGITGIAGPSGGTAEKPVGTIYVAIADDDSVHYEKFVFATDRTVNRELAVGRALGMLYQKLTEKNK